MSKVNLGLRVILILNNFVAIIWRIFVRKMIDR